MEILFSPAKEMVYQENLAHKLKTLLPPGEIVENPMVQMLRDKFKSLSPEELGRLFKISPKKSMEVHDCYRETRRVPALSLYRGLSYKVLSPETLGEESLKFLGEHLIILSALYGPLRPQDLILPYRLDFTLSLKRWNLPSLRSLWTEEYGEKLESMTWGKSVVDAASEEFSLLYSGPSQKGEFYGKGKDGTLKSHSTFRKKARGALVRFLAEGGALKEKEEIILPGDFYYTSFT